MGIQGLLPLLKSITVQTHVKQYAQQTLGVDAYVWLHRGAISCAWDLALGKHTTKYVDYALHRVKMLQHYGVTPYIVFDGDYLPSKAKTEDEREAKRLENTRLGKEYMARGNKKMAQEYFQKSIDITPDMALRFIQALQRENIEYVVAPYEADAQLAYMERVGLIDGIVTEDSDLLVFGCKTVLFKMNEFGECMEISRARFGDNTGMSLAGWNNDMFRYMAILSGCDYLASLPGMGLKTAHRLVRKYKRLESIFRGLRLELGMKLPADYEEKFRRADMTFLFQRVFCPLKQVMVMSHPCESNLDEETLRLIGAQLSDEVAQALASGLIDPITKQRIVLPEPGSQKPSLRHSKSAPPGNMLLDSFLTPKKAQPNVLAPLNPNTIPDSIEKRTAPRPSLREQSLAKKMKLFESSPSPPAKPIGRSISLNCNKENTTSPFFMPKASTVSKTSPQKMSQADLDLAAAIQASVQEEEKRKQFEGFQNPIAFEVQAQSSETTGVNSRHFVPESASTTKASQPRQRVLSQSFDNSGLPTPPQSQDHDDLVSTWRQKYTLNSTPSVPSTPSTQARQPFSFRASSSISKIGGQALSRRSSSPDLSSLQTRFTPRPTSLSQPPQQSHIP